jgi:hypothetical protein
MSTGLQTEKLPRLFEELCDEGEKHIDEITVVLSERVIRERIALFFCTVYDGNYNKNNLL